MKKNFQKTLFKILMLLTIICFWFASVYGWMNYAVISDEDTWPIMTRCDKEHGIYLDDYRDCIYEGRQKLIISRRPKLNLFLVLTYGIPLIFIYNYLFNKLKLFIPKSNTKSTVKQISTQGKIKRSRINIQ